MIEPLPISHYHTQAKEALLTIYRAKEWYEYEEGMRAFSATIQVLMKGSKHSKIKRHVTQLHAAHQFGYLEKMKECAAGLLPFFY